MFERKKDKAGLLRNNINHPVAEPTRVDYINSSFRLTGQLEIIVGGSKWGIMGHTLDL